MDSQSPKGRRIRRPHCSRCRNHGVTTPLKGHKLHCKFMKCFCERCVLTLEGQRIMAAQIALKRKHSVDEKAKKKSCAEVTGTSYFSTNSRFALPVTISNNSNDYQTQIQPLKTTEKLYQEKMSNLTPIHPDERYNLRSKRLLTSYKFFNPEVIRSECRPRKLSPVELLHRIFPSKQKSLLQMVLQSTNGDLAKAIEHFLLPNGEQLQNHPSISHGYSLAGRNIPVIPRQMPMHPFGSLKSAFTPIPSPIASISRRLEGESNTSKYISKCPASSAYDPSVLT